MKHLLGTGELDWSAEERRSDRYGAVGLFSGEESIRLEPAKSLQGKHGKLFAKVIETCESHHCGDFHRGIFPSTPDAGECLPLGEGTLFVEEGKTFY